MGALATAVGAESGRAEVTGASVCRPCAARKCRWRRARTLTAVKIVGLYLVRNEADVIETNLRHHFASVIDEAIVLDNGSTDGTPELVAELALDPDLPIQLSSEVGPIYQSDRMTRLARLATLEGADWVLPIDADEFWVGTAAPFRDVLARTPAEVRALFVELVNFVQRRDVHVAEPGCIETMTRRPARPIGPVAETPRLVSDEEISWVEVEHTPKSVHRAAAGIFIPTGNHRTGIEGVVTDELACLHAGIRARSVLAAKLDHGRRSIEEGSPPGSAWHLKRWWGLARAHAFDREWAALSYDGEHGAITVGGRARPLDRDDRLRDVAHAVAPRLRVTRRDTAGPTDEMEPAVGAYFFGRDTVPGWFDPLDFRVLVELDRVQRAHGVAGDVFEIGTYYGKTAILLGHLLRRPAERLTVCDVFEHAELIDAESWPAFNHWYAGVTRDAFEQQYQRFHDDLPEVIAGLSDSIDVAARGGTCRLVHVDGGHAYDVVRGDAATAETMLRPGGIVAFDDISAAHNPGVALAVWELVLGGRFAPLCLTQQKLYGTWDAGGLDWTAALDAWVEREPDLGSEVHTLAGRPVRRLFALPRHDGGATDLMVVPDVAELDARLAALGAGASGGETATAGADPA